MYMDVHSSPKHMATSGEFGHSFDEQPKCMLGGKLRRRQPSHISLAVIQPAGRAHSGVAASHQGSLIFLVLHHTPSSPPLRGPDALTPSDWKLWAVEAQKYFITFCAGKTSDQ